VSDAGGNGGKKRHLLVRIRKHRALEFVSDVGGEWKHEDTPFGNNFHLALVFVCEEPSMRKNAKASCFGICERCGRGIEACRDRKS
jgi:hypothetical protein